MKILVTGGTGFIGSHLVDRLVEAGHEVYVVDDLSGGSNANSRALYYKIDCRNEVNVDKMVQECKPEIVYHLAANAAENKAQFSPRDITSRGYQAFINMLTAAIKHKVRRFIFTSSIAVYGKIDWPFKESDQPQPEDLYGIGKLAAEQALKVMHEVHGIEYVILRPHNVYGPRQSMTDPYRNVVALWMNSLLHNKPYTIFGSGANVRQYTYIDDVVEALLISMDTPHVNQVYNVGADKGLSLLQLSSALQRVTGGKIPPEHLEGRAQEVSIAMSDHKKIQTLFQLFKNTDILEGLQKTWKYAQEKGPQEHVFDTLELDSPKVPKSWRQ